MHTRIERTHVSCQVILPQHMYPWLPPRINYASNRRTRTIVPGAAVLLFIDNNNVMIDGELDDGEQVARGRGTRDFFELVVSPLIIQVIWFVRRLHSGHANHWRVESLLNFALLVNATLSNWNSYVSKAPPSPPPPPLLCRLQRSLSLFARWPSHMRIGTILFQ